MKYRTFGILAHVDAGKTTLSEAMLYLTGQIRKAGRVDRGDTHLDTDAIERERGITIFSKQARLIFPDMEMTLLDTPGHVDFSAETERVLQVLDFAVLVVSGSDGVESHTRTLWKLLQHYDVPVLFFVNKMDLAGADHDAVLAQMKKELSPECVDFSLPGSERMEETAMCGEDLLDALMETGDIPDGMIRDAVSQRKLFPVWFGSALKMENLDGLMEGIQLYTSSKLPEETAGNTYGARVFKIGRDAAGARLTYLRVTEGSLKVRMPVTYRAADGTEYTEKIDQIRFYSGEQSEQAQEAACGRICAVTGLSMTMAGCGIGTEKQADLPVIEPVIQRSLILPPDQNAVSFYRKLLPLAEEEPTLHIIWNEKERCIDLQIMGEVQVEVLTRLIKDRYDVSVSCGDARIIYKETVTKPAEGVGHFEPLRHYAEVHLLLEPGGTGSGITVSSSVSEDDLDLHWQRLILTHVLEREHAGVLTGSGLTDTRITLIAGRAHLKHTEGGDFRQATYRAIRQGLMMTESTLLEPYYSFVLEIPAGNLGRAVSDLTGMFASYTDPEFSPDGGTVTLSGSVPVSTSAGYAASVSAYTRGEGHLSLALLGYRECHNPAEVIAASGYDPEADTENPSASVFCSHGAGVVIPWYEVPGYAHIPCLSEHGPQDETQEAIREEEWEGFRARERRKKETGGVLTFEEDAELREIYAREFGSDTDGRKNAGQRRVKPGYAGRKEPIPEFRQKTDKHGNPIYPKKDERGEHLIVDGYNIIFQWPELRSLAEADISAARGKLLDLLSNYQGFLGYPVTVVFDAYRTKRNPASVNRWLNLSVVYTKENETADAYIERMVHEESGKYRFSVATSDGMEQLTILRLGALRVSSRMLREDMERISGEHGMSSDIMKI